MSKSRSDHNLFVVIVGIAAWIHSSWTFASVIGGASPVTAITDLGGAFHWLYWFLPAAASAAAIDVGMISLAEQFKRGHGTKSRLITFGVLSCISYIAQALFALSHGTSYEPSVGLSTASAGVARIVWEVLIWLLPGALPITLVLWAWSDTEDASKITIEMEPVTVTTTEPAQPLSEPEVELLPEPEAPAALAPGPAIEMHKAECRYCGWTGEYATPKLAGKGLATHYESCLVKIEQTR